MSETVLIRLNEVHKEFTLSTSGIGSIKTLLAWWQRRRYIHLHVLRGVSFEVKKGECLAVIGRNGAGKSTLLSLIARIYKPTSGYVEVTGRLAPLLELGAGFHPDLTGIENVYFNGIVLGLTRKQVEERIPSIHEFSEIGDHIYSPVRTYSSGMIARLGFSVAIHVDAEILLVDEVLSVGDYAFAQKCYERILEFRSKGGTILLVSHDLVSLERVADRCLWIQGGHVMQEGKPADVIQAYLKLSESDLKSDRS